MESGSLMDPIHDFRVEYKKLRAFLRLLSVVVAPGKIRIPKPLKKIYKKAGYVRDIQLHIENIKKEKEISAMPAGHLRRLRRELANEKKKLGRVMGSGILTETRKEIEKEIPARLTSSSIEKFIASKVAEIRTILSGSILPDKDLHQVRKNLKDLIYISKICGKELSLLFPWKKWGPEKEKEITGLADDLGRFQDFFVALNYLKKAHAFASGEEKELIADFRRRLQRRKNQLKRTLLQKFDDTGYF